MVQGDEINVYICKHPSRGYNLLGQGRMEPKQDCKQFFKKCEKVFKSFAITILSQHNNNHNPNNKTTITVVGLRLSNRWEYHHPHHHTNSKLHDTAEIEQNSENKIY